MNPPASTAIQWGSKVSMSLADAHIQGYIVQGNFCCASIFSALDDAMW